MAVEFRAPRWSDVRRISRDMADIDALECRAMGRDPRASLELALFASHIAWAAVVDGKAEAMLGVVAVSVIEGRGAPWLLGTERARRQGRAFMRDGPRFIATMQASFPVLENLVHRDNHRSRAWLARLGFQFDEEAVHRGGEPMLRFWKSADV